MFRLILNELLATTPGALAALFLDYDGESVDLACDRDLSDHDLRIIGAYQRIHLNSLGAIAGRTDGGSLYRMKLEFAALTILSSDLKDGYYLVLLADDTANEGLAWRRLERCREKLLAEM